MHLQNDRVRTSKIVCQLDERSSLAHNGSTDSDLDVRGELAFSVGYEVCSVCQLGMVCVNFDIWV